MILKQQYHSCFFLRLFSCPQNNPHYYLIDHLIVRLIFDNEYLIESLMYGHSSHSHETMLHNNDLIPLEHSQQIIHTRVFHHLATMLYFLHCIYLYNSFIE